MFDLLKTLRSRFQPLTNLVFVNTDCKFIVVISVINNNNIIVLYFHIVSDACGGIIEATNGTITSPSFPDLYPGNKSCVWEIIAPTQFKITLNFTHFDLEGNNVSQISNVTTFARKTVFVKSWFYFSVTSGEWKRLLKKKKKRSDLHERQKYYCFGRSRRTH